MTTEIIAREYKDIPIFAGMDEDKQVTQKFISATKALIGQDIPKDAIKERIGRGKKTFYYLESAWVEEQYQRAFGRLWGFELLDYEIHKDTSVTAICKFTLNIPLENGGFIPQVFIIPGSFLNELKMPDTYAVSAAYSMALTKSARIAFGIGDFRIQEEKADPLEAWALLLYVAGGNDNVEKLKEEIKKEIPRVELVDFADPDIFGKAHEIAENVAKQAAHEKLVGLHGEDPLNEPKKEKAPAEPKAKPKVEPTPEPEPEPEPEPKPKPEVERIDLDPLDFVDDDNLPKDFPFELIDFDWVPKDWNEVRERLDKLGIKYSRAQKIMHSTYNVCLKEELGEYWQLMVKNIQDKVLILGEV